MTREASNPALHALSPLLGEWDVESPRFPGVRGRTTFEWLEGGAYLVERSSVPDRAPDSTWLVGADDSMDTCTALYHDSRNVSRVYRMSLTGDTWRVWREAPGFSQRFTGTLNEDGSIIRGAWELSSDGSEWEHDFDLAYTRTQPSAGS